MIYDNLHEEMLAAIQSARNNNLSYIVLALQNAIGCISQLQKDSEELELIRRILGVPYKYDYIRPMRRYP